MSSLSEQPAGHRLRLQHVSLPIPNDSQESVRAFYGRLIGLKEKPVPHILEQRGIIWFAAGEDEMELHFLPDPQHLANRQEGRHICLEVDNLEDYRHRLIQAGHEIIEADPIPHRPRFFCIDPFGNRLEFTTIQGNYLATEV